MALNSFFGFWSIAVQPLDDRDRARDVLRRDRLQQRPRAIASDVGLLLRGFGRSRRRRLADVPLRDVPRLSRTALVAGGLLAFALSWDEIVVTYFTAGSQNTLPLLIFGKIRQGQQLPE